MTENKQKVALITGATGQDGSFLIELLLQKGYKVIGLKRRTSLINASERIDGVFTNPNFKLVYGNMSDSSSLYKILNEYKPDEIYNLAAQSHVKVSFDVPEETLDVVGMGTLRLLNAMKEVCPNARFYQASSSEMYGTSACPVAGYTEDIAMHPASPYACAKLYAHNIVKNYRNSYGMHLSSGILFNHETLAGFMPLIYKIGKISKEIDIKPISEIVKYHTLKSKTPAIDESKNKYQETCVDTELYVWDKNDWTKVTYASGYPHMIKTDNKKPRFIISKKSAVFATGNHPHIMADNSEKDFSKIEKSDKISLVSMLPAAEQNNILSTEEAMLIGYIVGDGYVNYDKKTIRLTSKDKNELKTYENIWKQLGKEVYYYKGKSGFNKENTIWQLTLNGSSEWIKKYIPDIYTENKLKRVPKIILNSNKELMLSFLKGYNQADGLKKNKCVYDFKNFKTNSATLASGLIYLIEKTTQQKFNINVEYVYKFNKYNIYYSINLLSNSNRADYENNNKFIKVKDLLSKNVPMRKISRETKISRKLIQKINKGYKPNENHHLSIKDNEVKKIIDIHDYDGWFYDLETESHTFNAGVGHGHVHNSPRRGETFVSRKISMAAARVKTGVQDKLYLGNLDALRDWGYAREYVEGMWLMLQQDKPDDYVLATGETHTVREYLEETFKLAGLDINKHVEIDPRLFRPEEVPYLLGNYNKAKDQLGWEPKIKFKELVELMYNYEIENIVK